jgi:hypothetical protein
MKRVHKSWMDANPIRVAPRVSRYRLDGLPIARHPWLGSLPTNMLRDEGARGEVIPYLVYVVCIVLPACRGSTVVEVKAKCSFWDCLCIGLLSLASHHTKWA